MNLPLAALDRIAGAEPVWFDPTERLELATLFRGIADREVGYVLDLDLDTSELMVELSQDPTYAYSPDAIEQRVEAEQRQLDKAKWQASVQWSSVHDLANEVEWSGLIDLRDQATQYAVKEVMDYLGHEVR